MKIKRLLYSGVLLGAVTALMIGTGVVVAQNNIGKPPKLLPCRVRQHDNSVPPGPPGMAPTRNCKAVGKKVPGGRVRADDRPALGGYNIVGAETGHEAVPETNQTTWGIWGSISVSDPDIDPFTNLQRKHFVASFFQLDDYVQNGGNGMEAGWLECNYAGTCTDNQVVFSANSNDGFTNPTYFPQYSLTVGNDYYFSVTYQGNNVWRTEIWWDGAWETLQQETLSMTSADLIRENFEVFDDAASPTVGVPNTYFGRTQNVQLYPSQQNWRDWDQFFDTEKRFSIQGYTSFWNADYDDWYASGNP